MKKYMYFPGCSLEGIAKPYSDSMLSVCQTLGIELQEIDDWNCCGATEYGSLHRFGNLALQGRNLALAEKQAIDANVITAPCSACYLNLLKTELLLREHSDVAAKVNDALSAGGMSYTPGTFDIRHFLDLVLSDIGLDEIKKNVVKPLTGLRVGAYYGCVIVRPDPENRFGGHEFPTVLEDLIEALGAEVVDYRLKTHCCSGHMPSISTSTAYGLIHELVKGAVDQEIDLLVTLCPMCQMNVDAYQGDMNRFVGSNDKMPILYFTQLMGLAFGKSYSELAIGQEFVDSRPALSKIGKAPAEVEKPARKKEEGIPMPKMPAKEEVKA
jgi:heterodisulfide reductase subunit B2